MSTKDFDHRVMFDALASRLRKLEAHKSAGLLVDHLIRAQHTTLSAAITLAQLDALEIDAQRPSADDCTDDLLDELGYSTDIARCALIRAELQRRSDAEVLDECVPCIIGTTHCVHCPGDCSECVDAADATHLQRSTQHTTKVSLVKTYVPTPAVIVGRMDRPVYSPLNRTPRRQHTIDDVRVWSVLEHHNLICLHRIIRHAS